VRAEYVDCRIDPGQSGDCPLQLVLIQEALVGTVDRQGWDAPPPTAHRGWIADPENNSVLSLRASSFLAGRKPERKSIRFSGILARIASSCLLHAHASGPWAYRPVSKKILSTPLNI
jgi:hypothetical protein